jgi:hypothetical protein
MDKPYSPVGEPVLRGSQPDRQPPGTLPDQIGETELDALNSALESLFTKLREARAQFAQDGGNGRLGAFTALGAFWKFITLFRTPYIETLQVPILRLQDALAKLEENRVEPILQPVRRPRGGRTPSSTTYASLKGQAVATVELLFRLGLDRSAARLIVAKELSKLGVRPERGSGTVTANTLRNWRDEVSSDVGRHNAAAVIYDMVLSPSELAEFANMPNDQARERALGLLTHWVKSVFPELQKPS